MLSHICHMNLFASQIVMFGFPPHTTHILQPLDVGIFGQIKKAFNSICVTAGLRSAKNVITRSCFPITWKNSIERGATTAVVPLGGLEYTPSTQQLLTKQK